MKNDSIARIKKMLLMYVVSFVCACNTASMEVGDGMAADVFEDIVRSDGGFLDIETGTHDAASPGADAGSIDMAWVRAPVTETDWVIVHVPSAAAGSEGVAVRVAWPRDPAARRYREGAPIVIDVLGGHQAAGFSERGGMASIDDRADLGFVSLLFVMPGGTDLQTGARSGGRFDYRGPSCAQALADVIRFASGALAARDEMGRQVRIDEIVPYSIRTDEIGIAASSNGGNLAIVTLARHGAETAAVRFLVGWENPVADQVVTFEFSDARSSNPAYRPRSCTAVGCTVDYASLRVVSTPPRAIPSWDSPPTGPAIETLTVSEAFVFDTDADGAIDPNEFTLTPRIARLREGEPLRGFLSLELRTYLETRGMAPSWLASVADTQQFWDERDAGSGGPMGQYRAVVSSHPDLAVVVLGSSTDHGQPRLTDHPLQVMQYLGWRQSGVRWVRFNPDAAYTVRAGATHAEAAPNADLDVDAIVAALAPDTLDRQLMDIALEEMADRTHAARWEDLGAPLWPRP